MKKKEKRKNDSRVKTRKGGLEQKQENFQRLMGGANRKMKEQRPDSIRSLYEVLYPFQNWKVEPSIPKCLPSNSRVYHDGSWRLSNCHVQRLEKINLFKMLDFQRIHFSRKRPLKGATPFAQPSCENKSFEPDHQIPSQCPIQIFLTVITSFFFFFWASSQK